MHSVFTISVPHNTLNLIVFRR